MKIFISYAREQATQVPAIKQALEIHEVWFDQNLQMGQTWWDEIQRQIAACHCFMFLLSPESIVSEYCQKELDFALQLDKPIAPVMIAAMEIPERLNRFQMISVKENFAPEDMVRLLNGLFEIERQVFNPLRQNSTNTALAKLSIADLYFATTNLRKKTMYEQILDTKLQTAALDLKDIQHVNAEEVALDKAKQAYEILHKPVFVEHSALAIRAWGGIPGGLTTSFRLPVGLGNICKMLQPFDDKYAEAISVIAFTDGQIARTFVGVVPGEIPDQPRGNGYSWDNIFIPAGFSKTLGEMTESEVLSISSRRRAIIAFMRFLQSNYTIS